MAYVPKHHVRFITASSLFDGHDASINIIRRILQASGAEVIHLGHNRSVDEIVNAAIQEDVQGIAVSSYQGGHVEFFKYMVDLLEKQNASHIRIFGGGGGVIVPREQKELEAYGIAKIFSPEDGRELGLQGMIDEMLKVCDFSLTSDETPCRKQIRAKNNGAIARTITFVEEGKMIELSPLEKNIPVLGITGTGGSGKSSLTDELVRRYLHAFPKKTVAILSVDPTRQKTGGALLGDRIRMNAIHTERVYMRSLATRHSKTELSESINEVISVVKAAGYDLIIVETSGIGQGNAEIVEFSDVTLYVMTSEFGAPTQLEKIEMLDFADVIAINKFDRRGSKDALQAVKKQYQRNLQLFHIPVENMPVYGTMASQFNDQGTNKLFKAILTKINEVNKGNWTLPIDIIEGNNEMKIIIPPERTNYLNEIVLTVRSYHKQTEAQAKLAQQAFQIDGTIQLLREKTISDDSFHTLKTIKAEIDRTLSSETKMLLKNWKQLKKSYAKKQYVTKVRDNEIVTDLKVTSLSGLQIPKVSLPKYSDWGEIVRWLRKENVPGSFPFTAGVFPFKRQTEDPKRQFAGEGPPERTNRRFHYLSKNDAAKRLSTAFDSVTLYGEDPDYRPDIFGKVGESGVSVCTLDDMKKLYDGFDLIDPSTSVSMTINGPAPIILAMFMNTAIDQQLKAFEKANNRKPTEDEKMQIKARTLENVRGTVQADILKEDQGQNTCIFSTEFALRMMGDIQQYFIDHNVKNYYSVSISGYHIAEAGANPISQLAFTLANGFTYVEYYLSRGMNIDEFAPNFSFFFSNGLDPEYTVIGRVARRIWAIVMREKYGANERSQKLKYHIQTSGRSLHAQEMAFNDIRTTLQALMAIYDHCNSLHTNAYDEAVTTPTEESVRRAMAIQLIITKELGLAKNENSLQGSFIIEELTDLVEEAVLLEFERLNERGGVLGAMETQYQRSKIQEESMYYESLKHAGTLPIIGVNTYRNEEATVQEDDDIPLVRATKAEKELQINNLNQFKEKHQKDADKALKKLKETALNGGNIFSELMETVKVASLGQITQALYEVGGKYRRNM
ncbi:fused isobutyryl-CoA mutase/GTPase IcmF [Pueribacillus sp. YX66]|uniref:fused isobutyryl-CoA mutase/GTPase IcmF n=1 Tax=Pueribacillus sp. YX66 TaxID=3229242 RepID=UPI00358D85C9